MNFKTFLVLIFSFLTYEPIYHQIFNRKAIIKGIKLLIFQFMNIVSNQKLKQISFFLLLIFLAIFIITELSYFIPGMLGAVTFYVMLRHPFFYLTEKKKWNTYLSASVLMLLSFLIILVPISFIVNILYSKIDFAITNSNQVLSSIDQYINIIEKKYHIVLFSDKNIQQIESSFATIFQQILGVTMGSVVTIVILYLLLYFLLIRARALESWIGNNLPLKQSNSNKLLKNLKRMVLSNAIGIPITALLQGIIGVIGYKILGINDLSFWFAMTCITAVIPMVGSALTFVPVAILLFSEGHNIQGIIMLIYGFGLMYAMDSVFRMIIQKKIGNVHPLITTFGVILGIKLFGFFGLIFGPILLSLFFLLVEIYMDEYRLKN